MTKYRPEVDGLRGVAVLPVILYHAGAPAVSGGYVGVDIFFVISGFLITTILLDDLAVGTFSIASFYERRTRRILPALFAMMAACVPFAWLWMSPAQLMAFGKSLVAVTVFASNVYFRRSVDYFTPASEEIPLLHTWSLAVEEQYYVVAPVALYLIWRFQRRHLALWLGAAFMASFLACEWGWRFSPSANYYMIWSRAWELLIGSLGALYARHALPKSSDVLSGAGLGLIGYSIFALNGGTPFPSYYALLPTLGTVLILLFASQESRVARLLSMKLVRGIGLISYSAYLWHQPLLAFVRIRSIGAPSPILLASAVVASLAMGYLSWRFVERPFRKNKTGTSMSRRKIFSLAAAGCALAILIGAVGIVAKGFPQRYDVRMLAKIDSARLDGGQNMPCLWGNFETFTANSECIVGDKSAKRLSFIVVGDSYATAYGPGIDAAANRQGLRGALLTTASCLPITSLGANWEPGVVACDALHQKMLRLLQAANVKQIILSANWRALDTDAVCNLRHFDCGKRYDTEYKVGLMRKTIDLLLSKGMTVTLVGPPPKFPRDVPNAMLKTETYEGNDRITMPRAQATSSPVFDHFAASTYSARHAPVIRTDDAFCDTKVCTFAAAGVPFYFDAGHLTGTAAARVSAVFNPFMRKLLWDFTNRGRPR